MTDEYAGVVYDLDGTLVGLDVDWDAVAADVTAIYEDVGEDPGERSLWDLVADAGEAGIGADVEETIAAHERDGAEDSTVLPSADELADCEVPVAVCSLNAEAACRIALERHGLAEHVDAVVGRDTVDGLKPDPEPLLAAIERIDCRPAEVVFVGDSERDAETALRAGTAFRFAEPSADHSS